MKYKKIEEEIYESFEKRKPELFEKIMEQCPKMQKVNQKQSLLKRLSNIITNKKSAYSFASLGLIAVFMIVLLSRPEISPRAYSIVAIDVNPSVVLELDETDKVIRVVMNNDDALIIVGDMELEGVDLNIAVNALIGSMITNGYITELTNSVLLSIQSENQDKKTEFISNLNQLISNVLSAQTIAGSVITQELDLSQDAEDLSRELGISEAKAELILDIVKIDPRANAVDLAKLSINDLNLYLESKNYHFEDIEKTGSPSNLGIITQEVALETALSYFQLNMLDIVDYEIELEQEDGIIVYEVQIETAQNEYEIMVDAKENLVITDDEDDDEIELPNDLLSEEEILNLILSVLSISQNEISEVELEIKEENEFLYYEISFDYGDDEYELEVDAITGEIYTNSMDESGYNQDENESDETDETDELDD